MAQGQERGGWYNHQRCLSALELPFATITTSEVNDTMLTAARWTPAPDMGDTPTQLTGAKAGDQVDGSKDNGNPEGGALGHSQGAGVLLHGTLTSQHLHHTAAESMSLRKAKNTALPVRACLVNEFP